MNKTTNDLHALLDSLTDGEHVKATWTYESRVVTAEGSAYVGAGRFRSCHQALRWNDGKIHGTLTSFEVTRIEEVTATRDDEKALDDLLDSLEEGEIVTAEWHNGKGPMTLTGPVHLSAYFQEVRGYTFETLRWRDSRLHDTLRSVTVMRPVVQRWERADDEDMSI